MVLSQHSLPQFPAVLENRGCLLVAALRRQCHGIAAHCVERDWVFLGEMSSALFQGLPAQLFRLLQVALPAQADSVGACRPESVRVCSQCLLAVLPALVEQVCSLVISSLKGCISITPHCPECCGMRRSEFSLV